MNENTALEKSNPRFTIKKTGLAARLENAKDLVFDNPKEKPNRIGIIFDDSGSMGGKAIEDAHTGIDVFVQNCNVVDTSLALYPLNKEPRALTCDFMSIAFYGMSIPATGITPLYTKLAKLLDNEPITRAVAFSDGGPTDFEYDVISRYITRMIPIDTIYLGGSPEDSGAQTMKSIAERTGGIFLHFTDASVLGKSFKYLTPAYRAMLTSGSVDKSKVERGEI